MLWHAYKRLLITFYLLNADHFVWAGKFLSCTGKVFIRFFAPTGSISFLGLYLLFFANMFQWIERNPPAVQVSDPAIGLCRKILKIRSRRQFWAQVILRLLVSIMFYISASVLRTTKKLNGQFEANIAREHTRKKAQSWKKSARPSSSGRNDFRRVLRPAKQCSCCWDRLFFLLLCF